MKKKTKILVVEDNLTTAKTLRLFLESSGHIVDTAHNGVDGLQMSTSFNYDLVLLDLMLPDIDGIELCKKLREKSSVPIIMLTARSTEEDIVVGLEIGADDYVTKPFSSKELLARINRCINRIQNADSDSDILEHGILKIDLQSHKVVMGETTPRLTKTEFTILKVLMQNQHRIMTRDQLIHHSLGEEYNGFDRTIDTHIWSLRKKLGEPRGNPKYILSEPGIGYRLGDV